MDMRVSVGIILAVLLLAACGGGDGTDESPSSVPGDPAGDAAAPTGPTVLSADEMPAPLDDFPLPDDMTFPSAPIEEDGTLIVTLNSQTDAAEVIELINAGLEPAGYEVTAFIEEGPQWQFVKDGRAGVATVGSNPVATVITINLFP